MRGKSLEKWKGWPHKHAVPLLPQLNRGAACGTCGTREVVNSEVIAWVNHHGPHSTGLPEYWYLAIDHNPFHWGRPYYAEGQCPKCRAPTILSEMKYPDGTRQFMHNCRNCGVQDVG